MPLKKKAHNKKKKKHHLPAEKVTYKEVLTKANWI